MEKKSLYAVLTRIKTRVAFHLSKNTKIKVMVRYLGNQFTIFFKNLKIFLRKYLPLIIRRIKRILEILSKNKKIKVIVSFLKKNETIGLAMTYTVLIIVFFLFFRNIGTIFSVLENLVSRLGRILLHFWRIFTDILDLLGFLFFIFLKILKEILRQLFNGVKTLLYIIYKIIKKICILIYNIIQKICILIYNIIQFLGSMLVKFMRLFFPKK